MSKTPTHDLLLYFKYTCPFCTKVLAYLDQLKLEVPQKDISGSEEIIQELIKVGGKKQVPCLIIDGKPQYESGDIIKWLEDNYS